MGVFEDRPVVMRPVLRDAVKRTMSKKYLSILTSMSLFYNIIPRFSPDLFSPFVSVLEGYLVFWTLCVLLWFGVLAYVCFLGV